MDQREAIASCYSTREAIARYYSTRFEDKAFSIVTGEMERVTHLAANGAAAEAGAPPGGQEDAPGVTPVWSTDESSTIWAQSSGGSGSSGLQRRKERHGLSEESSENTRERQCLCLSRVKVQPLELLLEHLRELRQPGFVLEGCRNTPQQHVSGEH